MTSSSQASSLTISTGKDRPQLAPPPAAQKENQEQDFRVASAVKPVQVQLAVQSAADQENQGLGAGASSAVKPQIQRMGRERPFQAHVPNAGAGAVQVDRKEDEKKANDADEFVQAVEEPTRVDKDRISLNALRLLLETVGNMDLNTPSRELRQLPNGMKAYKQFLGARLFASEEAKAAYQDLKKRAEGIQQKIRNLPVELTAMSEYRKALQNEICELLKHPAYQAMKQHELDPVVHFLHTASDIIHNRSEGMSVFERRGIELLGQVDERPIGYDKLNQAIDKARVRSSKASVDTIPDRIFSHARLHPKRAFATWQSERAGSHLTYDPYKYGNYNAELGTYVINGVSLRSSAGPNPSHPDYQIFPAVNQRNENLSRLLDVQSRGPAHYQVILEGAEKKQGAKDRRDSMIAASAPLSQYSAMALPLDGEAVKGKGPFKNVKSAVDFSIQLNAQMNRAGYRNEIRQSEIDPGFRIPESMLTGDQLQVANDAFIRAFSHLEGTRAWNKQANDKTLSRTLLLGYDSVLCLHSMCRIADRERQMPENVRNLAIDGLPMTPTINFACKQGIDRGVILNMMLRMIVDARQRGQFVITREQLYQYCGYAVGRARTVEVRKIQKERYEALTAFIDLIVAASPEKQAVFLRDLGLPDDIRFVPSHLG